MEYIINPIGESGLEVIDGLDCGKSKEKKRNENENHDCKNQEVPDRNGCQESVSVHEKVREVLKLVELAHVAYVTGSRQRRIDVLSQS